MLHYLALSSTILRYLALYCTILHYLAPSCTILHHVASSCTILQSSLFPNMIVWWRVLYLSQMILFAMKPPCICKCVFDHSFFYVFDRFLYLFLCLLTIPCVFVSFDHSLYLVAQVLPHWLLVWAGATQVDASALFANCRPPSLSVAQCGQQHKYKKNHMNVKYNLTLMHSPQCLNWPMGDDYWLWLWNKT